MGYGFGDQGVLLDTTLESAGSEEFHSNLQHYATAHDVVVSLRRISATIPEGEEHYFSTELAPGDPPQEIPTFGNENTRILHSFADLNDSDNRGLYVLDGPAGSDVAFLHWANGMGLDGTLTENNFWNIVGQSPFLATGLLMLLGGSVMAAAHEIVRSRATAVKRLLGRPMLLNLMGEHVSSWRISVLGLLLSFGSTIAILGGNGFAQTRLFYLFFLGSLFFGLLGLLLGQIIGHAIAISVPLSAALKGQQAGLPLIAGLFVVRITALILALSILGVLTGGLSELKAQNAYSESWQSHDGALEVSITSAVGSDYYQLASTLRAMDRDGGLLLADRDWLTWPMDLGAPVVLVNTTFAYEEGLLSPEDFPSDDDEVVVIHPNVMEHSGRQQLAELLSFEASMAGVRAPDIRDITREHVGDVFTYDIDKASVVRGPIVVVLPKGLELLSNQNLASRLTRKSLLIKEERGIDHLKSDPDTLAFIGSAAPMIDSWQKKMELLEEDNQVTAMNFMISLLLSTALVLGTALVFHLRNQRSLWVGYILGRHPLKQRLALIYIEILFAMVPFVWLLKRYLDHVAARSSDAPSSIYLMHANSIPSSLIATILGMVCSWFALSIITSVKLPLERGSR